MLIWKDKKTGKWLTPKEFMARFSEGVQAVTPLQNVFVTLYGQVIVVIGILLGIIINIIYSIWWLVIVLFGSLAITSMSLIGTLQKYKFLKKLDTFEKEDILIKEEEMFDEEMAKIGGREK